MSQAKVDRYKEEKRNRAALMRREKRRTFITKLTACAVMTALTAWIGISAWIAVERKTEMTAEIPTYTADMSVIDDYLDSLAQ